MIDDLETKAAAPIWGPLAIERQDWRMMPMEAAVGRKREAIVVISELIKLD